MGRLKKYKTEQEKIEAQRDWAKEYYHRNKEVINKKTMENMQVCVHIACRPALHDV